MTVLFAHFSGRTETIDYSTADKYTFSQGVHVPDITMQTTAQNVKDYISKCTKIPTNHIFLTIGNGLGVKQESISQKHNLSSGITETYTHTYNWSYSNENDPTYSPKDDESILEAMKPQAKPILYFSTKTCPDLTHCPHVVKVRTLIKTTSKLCPEVLRIPYTSDTTISQLKEAIAAKTGIEKDQYMLVWVCSKNQSQDEATTIETVGKKEEDGSISACLVQKKSEAIPKDTLEMKVQASITNNFI